MGVRVALTEVTFLSNPPIGLTVWLTGLSSAGKSTIAERVFRELLSSGYRVEWLDGDRVRQSLCKGLGFSRGDRDENIARIAFVAEILTRHGVICIVSAISPYREGRERARTLTGNFVEVYVDAPLAVCESRDERQIYARARRGEIAHVTGLDDPYESPISPEVHCRTDIEDVDQSVRRVLDEIDRRLRGSR